MKVAKQGWIQGWGGGGGGGVVVGVMTPLFWGTPKLHKDEKNVALVCMNASHFSS